MNGFLAFTRRVASRMISLARAEPPGESTRSTTAFIVSSAAAASRALRIDELDATASWNIEAAWPPSVMGPST